MKTAKYLLPFILAALTVTAAGCGSADSSGASSKAETSSASAGTNKDSAAESVSSSAASEKPELTSAESSAAAESAATESAASEKAEEPASQSNTNTTYDVGEFSVFVPEGWVAIPVPDYMDSSKTATNDIQLAKGAEYNEASKMWNTDNGQYFYITLLNKDDFAKASTRRDYYVKEYGSVKDMEDMTTGSLTWHGFSVNPIGADVFIIWAEAGEGGFYSSISTAYDLSLQDDDIQKILCSLTLK